MWATFCQVILGHPEPKTLVNSLATSVNVAKETLKDSLDVLLPMILGRVTLILVSTLSFQVQLYQTLSSPQRPVPPVTFVQISLLHHSVEISRIYSHNID